MAGRHCGLGREESQTCQGEGDGGEEGKRDMPFMKFFFVQQCGVITLNVLFRRPNYWKRWMKSLVSATW